MSMPNRIEKESGAPDPFLKTAYAGFREDLPGTRIDFGKSELDIHVLDLMVWWEETLFQVVDLYDDITVHQATGRRPRVGDVVRMVDREESFVYAISNTDKFTAYFNDKQLHPL